VSTAEQIWVPSVRFKNILFAMDFSPASLLAFPFAASIAARYGGNVLVAHVLPSTSEAANPFTAHAAVKKLESEIEAALASSFGSLRDVPCELLVDHGSVTSNVLAEAEKRDIDLIVIGMQGLRGLKKLFRGSIAEEVSSLSMEPVLMVGPNVVRRAEFKRILYATDFSLASVHALPYGLSLANAYHASLLFLHVNEPSSKELPSDAQPKTFEFVRDQLLSSGVGSEMERRIEVIVEFGSATETILETAVKRRADLIILGIQATKGIKNRIAAHLPGKLNYKVGSLAPCPVLTVALERHSVR
jgi:nucleotide-binding universal stress UspA family protein